MLVSSFAWLCYLTTDEEQDQGKSYQARRSRTMKQIKRVWSRQADRQVDTECGQTGQVLPPQSPGCKKAWQGKCNRILRGRKKKNVQSFQKNQRGRSRNMKKNKICNKRICPPWFTDETWLVEFAYCVPSTSSEILSINLMFFFKS